MKSFLLLIVFLPLCIIGQQPTPEQIEQVELAKKKVKKMKGEPFPEFELQSRNGDLFNNENTKGKYVLFNFWFAGCRPCVEELPELNQLVKDFQDQNVVFLAPTFDNERTVDRFINRFPFEYASIPDVKDFCLSLDIRSYPTHFLIDRNGIIRKVIIGYNEYSVQSLRKSLNKLLRSE